MPALPRLSLSSGRFMSALFVILMPLVALLEGCVGAPDTAPPRASSILLATVQQVTSKGGTTTLLAYHADTGKLLWQVTPASSPPQAFTDTAASQDTVYLTGGSAEAVLAYDAQTGQQRWSAKLHPSYQARGIAATAAGVLVAERAISNNLTPSVLVESFRAFDGQRQWSSALPSPLSLDPDLLVTSGDTVYLDAFPRDGAYLSMGEAVFALNLETGALRWHLPFAGVFVDGSEADQNSLYLVSSGPWDNIGKPPPSTPLILTAYDALSGHPRWHVQGPAIPQTFTVSGGVLYGPQCFPRAAGDTCRFFALDAATGKQLHTWQVPYGITFTSHVALDKDSVYFSTAENPNDPPAGTLGVLALNVTDGSQHWNLPISHRQGTFEIARPLVTTGAVYVILPGFPDSQIEALTPADGQPRWTVQLPGQLREGGLDNDVLLNGG